MKYFKNYENEYDKYFYKHPENFDKTTDKEILKYCVGTLLYIPSVNKKMLNDLCNLNIKDSSCVSICLEDSVGALGEGEAIENTSYALNTLRNNIENNIVNKEDMPLTFIRFRSVEQMMKLKDSIKDNLSILTGIIIPKANKEKIEDFITALKEMDCESLYIMPIIETTEFTNPKTKNEALHGLYDVVENNMDKILCIRTGVTDILGAYSTRRNKNLTIYDNIIFNTFAYDLMSLFGGGNSVSVPISGGVTEFYDMKDSEILDAYVREIDIDKLNGFMGKTVIHPMQIKVVQAKLAVSYEDYIDAENILANAEGKSGVSAGVFKNRMNEVYPHLRWAKKIVTLGKIYGVLKEGVDYSELLKF